MEPLSVCIIACDEEDRIGRCLDSAAFADDRLVVLDARSRDRTGELAVERGARVIVHPYRGNIEQKNFALEQAKHDWVLSLDADEALSPELAAALRQLLREPEALSGIDGVELDRVTFHLGRWIRHGDFHPDWQLRLFRRAGARFTGVNPHGRVRVEGRVLRVAGELEHYSYDDFADQLERIQSFSTIQADELERRGRRVHARDLVLSPPWRFFRAYVLKRGFLDGWPGFVVAAATAFHVFAKYAKLWERQRVRPSPDDPH
jgi:glycosyltransferase involved in cell wall biosynthesis